MDTSFGLRDVCSPYTRLNPFFIYLKDIQFAQTCTAIAQIEQLGFSAQDVRHIISTHLDFDHAGGLEDFPNAIVHVMQSEMDAVKDRQGFIDSKRYRHEQWDEVKHWEFYAAGGEDWFGFKAVRGLKGLPPEILLIPLTGHTRGHGGVAIETPQGWLFHAGDAYFFRHEMDPKNRHCTPGLQFYQWMMEVDRKDRLFNQDRLYELASDRDKDVRLFCSHDAIEFKAFAGHFTTPQTLSNHY